MVIRTTIIFWIGMACATALVTAEGQFRVTALEVGPFSKDQPGDQLPINWEKLTFPSIENPTRYRLVHHQDTVAVEAHSQAGASGLIRHLAFDAQQYPLLTWRWRIDHVLEKGDLRSKKGDDYAARLYIAFQFEPQKASWWERFTHALASSSAGRVLPGTMLTYIWANQAPVGVVASNPHVAQVKMVVLQSGNANAGQWISERRNIVEDYMLAFGHPPPPAIGVAIMTDTDNTGESTSAFYGDISLLPKQ